MMVASLIFHRREGESPNQYRGNDRTNKGKEQ
jgi:hypothetical protein